MAKGAVLDIHVFSMNNKQRTRKKSTGTGAKMEGEFWSICGVKD
jgi:hypothetical protein